MTSSIFYDVITLFFLMPHRLQFCSPDDVITLKGRVACEVSSGDELVITEMIFNGVFNDLDGDYINIIFVYMCVLCMF